MRPAVDLEEGGREDFLAEEIANAGGAGEGDVGEALSENRRDIDQLLVLEESHFTSQSQLNDGLGRRSHAAVEVLAGVERVVVWDNHLLPLLALEIELFLLRLRRLGRRILSLGVVLSEVELLLVGYRCSDLRCVVSGRRSLLLLDGRYLLLSGPDEARKRAVEGMRARASS